MEVDHLRGRNILVVDLDGTLVRSDMLYESFWAATSRDWRTPIRVCLFLLQGRAAVKRRLMMDSSIDIETLPYDPQVIDYVRKWRDDGGAAVLVTASDHGIAKRIGDYLGIFDAVQGSDKGVNLKSTEKAAFLTRTFGEEKFTYMGDANADIPVWNAAGKTITVNAPDWLKSRAESTSVEVEHLHTYDVRPRDYLRALRVHQWLKNLLIFLPMLTAHQVDLKTLLQSLIAFITFSIVASGIYLLNDLLDLQADRVHPNKRHRPFAAGTIPIGYGLYLIIGLLGLGFILSLFLSWSFVAIMVFYVVATTSYSVKLKRKAIVDIGMLAGLYTTRIIAGAIATGIPLSMWLLAFSVFFFFSLATVKRQAELTDGAARGKLKTAGRGYTVDDLPVLVMMAVASGYVSVLVMALYIQSPDVSGLYAIPEVLSMVCGVLLYWVSRIILIAHRGHLHEDPVVFAALDRTSLVCALIIVAAAVGATVL